MSDRMRSSETAQHHDAHDLQLRNILVLLLTCAAGAADAIGYLGFGYVFTAAMTGNTVLLGLALGQGQPQAIFFGEQYRSGAGSARVADTTCE